MANVSPQGKVIPTHTPAYKSPRFWLGALATAGAIGAGTLVALAWRDAGAKKTAAAAPAERVLLIGRAAVPESCFAPGQTLSNPTGSCATAMGTYGRAVKTLLTP